MRGIGVGIAAMVCAAALGQPALEAGRGMSFQYSGPAGELLPAFEVALGLGAEPADWGDRLRGTVGEKPVSVSMKGARMFDILAAIEKAVGVRLWFSEVFGQPRLDPTPIAGRQGASPRGSTADCDVVVEFVDLEVGRRFTWGEDGAHAGAPGGSMALALRVYPVDERAAGRLVGFKLPGLTLVRPDGSQHDIRIGADWGGGFMTTFGRCMRSRREQMSAAVMAAGEYKLQGALLVARVDPVVGEAVTVADVGKTVDLGAVKVTVKSWSGERRELDWEAEGPKPDLVGEEPSQMPVGVMWIEALGRGKGGEVLCPTGGGGGYNGSKYVGGVYWRDEPVSVEFRALIISKAEDVVAEPFEVAFTLPAEFLGK